MVGVLERILAVLIVMDWMTTEGVDLHFEGISIRCTRRRLGELGWREHNGLQIELVLGLTFDWSLWALLDRSEFLGFIFTSHVMVVIVSSRLWRGRIHLSVCKVVISLGSQSSSY